MAMLFWRIFSIIFGMVFVAIMVLDIVTRVRWSDAFPILILSGALMGGTFGWALSVLIPKTGEWLRDNPPTPTPRYVLRLGWSLGMAEGIVVGGFHGGILAAVLGGFFGMFLGQCTAALSWYVRRQTPLVLLALFLGFLIEVCGCLFIVWIVQILALDPFMMWVQSGLLVLFFLLRLCQYRRFKPAQQE